SARFLAAIDLGGAVFETESLPEPLLPPDPFRRGNRYWRINVGTHEGYALVVSRDIRCATSRAAAASTSSQRPKPWPPRRTSLITGSASAKSAKRAWSRPSSDCEEPKLALVLSRASAPNARRDRAQVIATATYDLGR
ncbi:hypothetical protein, partial [Rhizobium sp. SAFR-030]|uniref:hypothetical protein n=1 Tax=Rhizobium sp. SAFR-030 TaxID=3387277 RepID=UPI003F7FF6BE